MGNEGDLDRQIFEVQRGERTLFAFMYPIHTSLRQRSRAYHTWHTKPYAVAVHWALLGLSLVFAVTGVLAVVLTPFGRPSQAAAGINQQLPFQGRLTNSDGTVIADGSYDVVFKIYAASSGGVAVWTENHTSANQITTSKGIFNTMLGSITALSGVDFNSDSLYLGITVGADAEMTPRIRLGSAPYAANSDKLDGLDSTAFGILAGQSGGQTFKGGTASGENLTLMSTANATKGKILFGTSGYDEVNNRLGVGSSTPGASFYISTQTAALSGSANNYGLYAYPTSSGAEYIDAITSSSSTTDLNLRTYNNTTYNTLIGSSSAGTTTILQTGGSTRLTLTSSSAAFANNVTPSADDGAALGTASLRWSDLFLASGGVINWANGNMTLTQATGTLTVGGGNFLVTSPGTAANSVVTVDGTQTLTNKTLTTPKIGTALWDTNGLTVLGVTPVASAVVNLSISNNSTGNYPIINANGETNTGILMNVNGSGSLKVGNNVSTDDRIALAPAMGGGARFTGTITSADLTANRTYTLPDSSGTFTMFGSSVVQSITGTAHEVIASASTGAVTLSTPQDIDTISSPQFKLLGLGGAANSAIALYVNGNPTSGSGTGQNGVRSAVTFGSDATATGASFYSLPATTAASYTLSNLYGYYADTATLGASSAITSQYGYYASALTGATNNYGFYSALTSGTGKYAFYGAGSAQTYFGGTVSIRDNTLVTYSSIHSGGTLSGNASQYSFYNHSTFGSDATTLGIGYYSTSATAAAAFTLPLEVGFYAANVSIGAGSAVTDQRGFYAADLTSGTSNFGFYSNVSSGSNKWAFYGNGTAQSYFGGNVGVGTSSITSLLTVASSGNIDIATDSSNLLRFGYDTTNGGKIQSFIGGSNDKLSLNAAGGNVGIGTLSPGSTLDVKGTIRLSGATSGFVGFAPAAAAGSVTYTLPSVDGSAGQVLSSNGSAVLSWITTTDNTVMDGRLTLTSGTPVTISDVASSTNIYFTPYMGSRVTLYDGTKWVMTNFTEITKALGTLTSAKNYDVFLYNNSGTLTLELDAWNNDTTRFSSGTYATALPTQDGVYVKSTDGTTVDNTKRYVGTMRTISTTATADTAGQRLVYNYYNRVSRKLLATDSTSTWNYTTFTYREADGGSTCGTSRICIVQGVAENTVSVTALSEAVNTSSVNIWTGIGLDSSTVNSASISNTISTQTSGRFSVTALYQDVPGLGFHSLRWLEQSIAFGTTSWNGSAGGAGLDQTGLSGTSWQ